MMKLSRFSYFGIFVVLLSFYLIEDFKLFAQPTGIGQDSANFAKVDNVAPDFTADAYHDGKFKKISLSDYKGKWVLLCFYPGDFTFV